MHYLEYSIASQFDKIGNWDLEVVHRDYNKYSLRNSIRLFYCYLNSFNNTKKMVQNAQYVSQTVSCTS